MRSDVGRKPETDSVQGVQLDWQKLPFRTLEFFKRPASLAHLTGDHASLCILKHLSRRGYQSSCRPREAGLHDWGHTNP